MLYLVELFFLFCYSIGLYYISCYAYMNRNEQK